MEKLHNQYGNIQINSDEVYNYHLHMHTYYEMTLYEPFDGRVVVNGKDTEISTVTAILICPSDCHEIIVNDAMGARFIKIGFNTDVIIGMIPDFSIVLTNMQRDELTALMFKEICDKSYDKVYVKMLINCIMHTLVKDGNKITSVNTSKGYKIAVLAAKLVNENFNGSITLESAAKELSVAPQYLSAVFKQSLGINFSDYLCRMRLQYAAKQIKNTEKSITQICYDSGYGNFSHFSRSFKKRYGLSPREYRNIKQ